MHNPHAATPRRARVGGPLLALAALLVCSSGAAAAPDTPTPAAASAPAQTPVQAPVQAPAEDAMLQQGFARWVAAFRTGARAAGIDEATLRAAFDDARYLPRVIELDRTQPELTRTIWDYLDTAVSPQRVAQGQDKLLQFRAQADAAAARYGVAPAIIAAIWGLESKYGEHVGNTATIDALATLAFEGRREVWARGQLLAALKILQSGDITRANMIGSWAGAMGHTQWMPEVWLNVGMDYDKDGRVSPFGKPDDALGSSARYLLNRGKYHRGEHWG